MNFLRFAWLSFLVALVVASCSCTPAFGPAPTPAEVLSPAQLAEAKSVGLTNSDGASCGGTWVTRTHIVTAYHCVKVETPELPDDLNEILRELGLLPVTKSAIGTSVDYVTRPKGTVYHAIVRAIDPAADLALLEAAADPEEHAVARLSGRTLADGEPLDVVGSLAQMPLTYSRCYVMKSLTDDGFMQVGGTVYFGDSGGGAFDEYGDLVGVADKMLGDSRGVIQGMSFFIPGRLVRAFVLNNLP